MTNQQIKEIVKSFAYGYTVEQVSEIEGISLEEANKFKEDHAQEIVLKSEALKEGGWDEGR